MRVRKPELAAGFEKIEGADDVGGDEVTGAADGTIDVRFGREMHHVGDLVIANDAADGLAVAEIHFFEDVIRSAFDIGEICEVTCVGEAIEINEAINCGLIDDVPDKIGADETGAACNE